MPKLAQENSHRILDLNSKSSNSKADIQISIGPTTKLYFDGNDKAFNKAINFWSNFDQPTKYWALFYNYDDKSWSKRGI